MITPAIRDRVRELAADADTEVGLNRLCAYIVAYAVNPPAPADLPDSARALQPDGTRPMVRDPEAAIADHRRWLKTRTAAELRLEPLGAFSVRGS